MKGGKTMNKWMLGMSMGLMAGMALMMSPAGRMIKKDVRMGMNMAKKAAKAMDDPTM